MALYLVVITPFDGYQTGDTIQDQATIAAVRSTYNAINVVMVSDTVVPPPPPGQPITMTALLARIIGLEDELAAHLANLGNEGGSGGGNNGGGGTPPPSGATVLADDTDAGLVDESGAFLVI